MTKLGDGLHTTEEGDRIFVGPDVPRYPREDGGEVIVVSNPTPDDHADEDE